jgi:E3 ubiquitin-protein ligase synoviolin
MLTVPQMQRHGARSNAAAIPAGSIDLPPGVTIPEGWSLLPLQRLDSVAPVAQAGSIAGLAGIPATATTQRSVSPATGAMSNNTLTPTPTINPENQSLATSINSSDANNIHTPPSAVANQSVAPALNTLPSTTNLSSRAESRSAQEEPNLLNWGSSQLFSGTSRNSASNGASASFRPLISGQRGESATGAGPSGESSAGTTESGEEKGKGKAVTVEDADDELEDA